MAQPYEPQLQTDESDLFKQFIIADTSSPSTKKKGFVIYDSYKKAVRKITTSASSSSSAVDIESSLSTVVTEYLSETVRSIEDL